MSLLEWRGGFPVIFRGTVSITGLVTSSRGETIPAGTPIRIGQNQIFDELDGRRGPIISKWLRIANHGTGNQHIRIYFSQDHFDDDVHYTLVYAGALPMSIWDGPAEIKRIWFKSESSTPPFDITAFSRRG